MILAVSLSLLIGLSLGLLGGGGSILAVPILIYALGMDEKPAIATSLLVVAATSAVAAVQHARAGNVKWKVGLIFSAAGMAGAYAGGRLAKFIPSTVLLVLFALIMAATAIAMWRGRNEGAGAKSAEGATATGKIVADGLVVGVLTGLVGAGGGFLVVPALALLGGLPMHQAVGTSLFVIAMKSMAGFAGYVGHVSIDYKLAGVVIAAASAGTVAGALIGRRVEADRLRRGFALFVAAMALFILYKQIPQEALKAVIETYPWPFWVGGLAIGFFVILFLLGGKKLLGVSTGYADVCSLGVDPEAKRSWRIPFIAGIVGGAGIAAALSGRWIGGFEMGLFDQVLSASLAAKAVVFTLGGVLIGFGARLAGGCTSGHAIVGCAQLAPASLKATAGFMIAGFLVTNLLFRVIA